MNPTLKLLSILFIISIAASCKKEKEDDNVQERFIGLWVESSVKKDTLLVAEGENSGMLGPMIFLNSNGKPGIPFSFRFNNAADTIILTDLSASSTLRHNVPYKITFSNNTFSINKFHPYLPHEVAPLSFYIVR